MATPQQRRQAYDETPERREALAFYNGSTWRKFRKWFLRDPDHVFCLDCKEAGRMTVATDLDHIQSRKEHPELALEPSNIRPLCKSCHSTRTAKATGWGKGHGGGSN
jgi:5-methylcytosine-specific restriction protein A